MVAPKVHAVTDANGRPLSFLMTAGQVSPAPMPERHGISRPPDIERDGLSAVLQALPDRLLHIDITEVQAAEGKLYLFVGIDRTSRLAITQLVYRAEWRTAWKFFELLLKAVP